MKEGPDWRRVVDVVVSIALRISQVEDDETEGGLGANSGVLPCVD